MVNKEIKQPKIYDIMTNEKDFTLEELEDQLRILIDEKYETGNIDSSIEIQEEIKSLRRKIADLKAKK